MPKASGGFQPGKANPNYKHGFSTHGLVGVKTPCGYCGENTNCNYVRWSEKYGATIRRRVCLDPNCGKESWSIELIIAPVGEYNQDILNILNKKETSA